MDAVLIISLYKVEQLCSSKGLCMWMPGSFGKAELEDAGWRTWDEPDPWAVFGGCSVGSLLSHSRECRDGKKPGSGVLCPDITCPKTCSLTDLIQVTKSPCPQNTAN